ncbi:MAG: tetratricopeptide repeat protein [Myxococcaceae bacterium]
MTGRAAQLLEAGLWLRLSGDYAGASRLFQQALELDPNNERAQRLLRESGAPGSDPRAAELPAELRQGPTPTPTSAWDSKSGPGVHVREISEADSGVKNPMDWAIQKGPMATPLPSSAAAANPPEPQVAALLRGAQDLIGLDDHTGAMELILKAKAQAPDDPAVEAMRQKSEKTLLSMFESKIGDLAQTPHVLLKQDEVIWLNLDHRAGFVLAQIDGSVSFADLFELSGMARIDTARILAQLLDEGVIAQS